MSRFPPDVQSVELAKIEGERPILQAYKALMIWKDACGVDFDVRQLVDALRQNGRDDLVAMSLQILDSKLNHFTKMLNLFCGIYCSLLRIRNLTFLAD